MIKGVNKQVVDVTEPDSAYFERVLFFVKPEFSGLGEGALRHKANLLLRETEGERVSGIKRPLKKRIGGAVGFVLAAFAGAALTAIVLLIALK